MPIQTYSLKEDSATPLSSDFFVREFACKDGSDAILIDGALIDALQAVRDHYGKPVVITSAYRTAAYNAKTGGAKNSQHVQGMAADFRVPGTDPRKLAQWIEQNLWNRGVNGLGLYDYAPGDKSGFIHIDTRVSGAAQWVQTRSNAPTGYRIVRSITREYLTAGTQYNSDENPRVLRTGMSGPDVAKLAHDLLRLGLCCSLTYDTDIQTAVTALQRKADLTPDGVFGPASRAALKKILDPHKE